IASSALTNPPRQNNPKQGITSQYRHEDYKPSRIQRRSPPSIGTGERRKSRFFRVAVELRSRYVKQFKTRWNKPFSAVHPRAFVLHFALIYNIEY
ncbi:MAG TPA: hypothetical protein VGO59_02505, partial [Verrucomicrobiae bacterium]